MILSFGDTATADLYHARPTKNARRFPPDIVKVALRKLDVLNAAHQRINEIVRDKRGVTSETAWLFAQSLGTTPEFWANLQTGYDLALNRPKQQIAPLEVVR